MCVKDCGDLNIPILVIHPYIGFEGYDNVGFCRDSGHELCCNRGKDILEIYGDRLIATYLNDNLGVSDYNGIIFCTDDLHL